MKPIKLFALVCLTAPQALFAQVYTPPVGYFSIECKANTDTIIGVPLRQSPAFVGSLGAAPVISGDSATLTLSGSPGLTANQFANAYYAKFTSGAANGQWFLVTSNGSGSLVIALNGATLSAGLSDGLEVIKFWTLAELFNPAQSTTDATTTGNAIVASTSTGALGRKTSILLPNYAGVGINLSSSNTFFVHGSLWKEHGQGDIDRGNFQLWPDSYIIIRHPSSVTTSTTYVNTGQVEVNEFDIALNTRNGGPQDNLVALPRPVDITLNNLNLGGTAAFISSTSTGALGRRDQLFVFNYSSTGINKSAAATYFYHNGLWKAHGDGDIDRGNDIIPAGTGFVIRKYSSTGATANWNHTSPF